MARPAIIEDAELLDRLSSVFRDVGYAGASLARLSEATGLKKASLYYRFPDGKEQMAREVLLATRKWISETIFAVLKEDNSPQERIKQMCKTLDELYAGGKQACLLNMLSSAHIQQGPFSKIIKNIFTDWVKILSEVLVDAGLDKKTARMRSEQTLAQLQGSLVLSRGIGSTKPFRNFLKQLPESLFRKA
ncbi:hypothetical protein MNBD_ALPHA06-387 [hydrothermal vent metagenome]|uniref:Uncharacterized protein n=1 Tax=hydrothermal vent metagenome TaxID=652676 RepID=A0A3B0SCG4_9ZZZZ